MNTLHNSPLNNLLRPLLSTSQLSPAFAYFARHIHDLSPVTVSGLYTTEEIKL
jgi:hypothetical protein